MAILIFADLSTNADAVRHREKTTFCSHAQRQKYSWWFGPCHYWKSEHFGLSTLWVTYGTAGSLLYLDTQFTPRHLASIGERNSWIRVKMTVNNGDQTTAEGYYCCQTLIINTRTSL